MAGVTPELLARCLEAVQDGRSTIDDCAAAHPEAAPELRELLGLALSISAPEVTPTSAFRARARAALLERIQREPRRGWRRWLPLLAAPRRAIVATACAALVLLAGGGVLYASQDSLPGDTLYPVKTSLEQLRVTIAPNAAARAHVYLDIADTRAHEVSRAVRAGRANAARSAAQDYVRDAQQAVQSSRAADGGVAGVSLQQQVAAALTQQQSTLQTAQAGAPPAAREAIDQAITTAATIAPASPPSAPAAAPSPQPATPARSSNTTPAAGKQATPHAAATAQPAGATPSPTPAASGRRATGTPTDRTEPATSSPTTSPGGADAPPHGPTATPASGTVADSVDGRSVQLGQDAGAPSAPSPSPAIPTPAPTSSPTPGSEKKPSTTRAPDSASPQPAPPPTPGTPSPAPQLQTTHPARDHGNGADDPAGSPTPTPTADPGDHAHGRGD